MKFKIVGVICSDHCMLMSFGRRKSKNKKHDTQISWLPPQESPNFPWSIEYLDL